MARDLLIRLSAVDNASEKFVAAGRAGRQMGDDIDAGADKADKALEELDAAQDDVGRSAVEMVNDVGRASDALGRDLPEGAGRAERALETLDQAQDDAGQSALDMGRDMETAGRSADDLVSSTETAGRSLRDFENAGRTAGAGLALLGTSFALYANQAREHELAVDALRRTYGDATESFLALSNQLQSSTIFSNDQVLEAANIMGTLKRNYELTDQQIQQLIITSADLAAVNGTTLSDAAQRVAAAIRGEAESAEMLGLTMNQAAIDSDNLTLSMSNAEAGAFRYTALMEQAEFATGAAGDQAETTTGQVQQLANRVQDAATGFAAWTGPIGAATAGLSSFGLEAGLALTGAVQLARGIRTATVAMGGLSAVAGPAALVGALGLGVVAAVKLSDAMRSDLSKSMEETSRQAKTLEQLVNSMAASMDNAAMAIDISEGYEDIERMRSGIDALDAALKDLRYPMGLPPGADQSVIDDYNAYIAVQQEAQAQAAALAQEYGNLEAASQAVDQAQDAYKAILENTQPGAEAAIQTAINLFNAYERGEMTFSQLRDALNGVVADLPNYAIQALEAEAATQAAAEAAAVYAESLAEMRTELNQTTVAIGQYLSAWDPDAAQGKRFIEQAGEIERALALINRAMTDDVTSSGLEMFGGQAAFDQLEANLQSIQSSTEAGSGAVREWASQLTEAFLAGTITADAYANGITELVERGGEFANTVAIMSWELSQSATTAEDAEAAIDGYSLSLGSASNALGQTNKDTAALTDALLHHADAAQDVYFQIVNLAAAWEAADVVLGRVQQTTTDSTEAANRHADSLRYQAQALYDVAGGAEAVADRMQANPYGAFTEQLRDAADAVGLLDDAMEQLRATGFDIPELNLAIDTNTANQTLDRTFGAVVGQTNSWGQLSQSVADWAASLAHGELAQTRLDQALLQGIITHTTYQAALEANHEIQEANASIQEDLLRIQIKQMPVLAQLAQEQARYVDEVADLGPQAQLAALGFMDQATSMKALELAQLAAMATTDGMRDATGEMIVRMAEADPMLAAVLEKMGLISNEDGTITFNADAVGEADSAIEELNDTIGELNRLIARIFNIDTDTNALDTKGDVDDLTGAVNGIPKNVSTYVNLIDNASLRAGEIRDILNLLDGTTATTYVNTVQTGSLSLSGVSRATGGVIPFDAQPVVRDVPRFAGGGTLALVGEAGPEFVNLPGGAQVYSAPVTRTMAEDMARNGGSRSGVININGPVTLHPAGSDAYSAIRREALSRARGYR